MNVFLHFIGYIMDTTASMIIPVPVLLPVARALASTRCFSV